MQVILDNEEWTVNDGTPLIEVLAQVSDKAHTKNRLVTALQIGERCLTDRDLTRMLLSSSGTGIDRIHATSQSMGQVVEGVDKTMERYGSLLKSEGAALVAGLRKGQDAARSLDAWLGGLADYLECWEIRQSQVVFGRTSDTLIPCVDHLLEARAMRDWVSVADLVEYEILPRLPG